MPWRLFNLLNVNFIRNYIPKFQIENDMTYQTYKVMIYWSYDIPKLWHTKVMTYLSYDIPKLWYNEVMTYQSYDLPKLWNTEVMTHQSIIHLLQSQKHWQINSRNYRLPYDTLKNFHCFIEQYRWATHDWIGKRKS